MTVFTFRCNGPDHTVKYHEFEADYRVQAIALALKAGLNVDSDDPVAFAGPDGVLRLHLAETLARDEYLEKEWSGCGGSHWDQLSQSALRERILAKGYIASRLLDRLRDADYEVVKRIPVR